MSASITPITTPLTAEQPYGARAQSASGEEVSPKLRLTRRGRMVFGGLAMLLVLSAVAVLAMLGGTRAEASAEVADAQFGYVVVQPGASLWQLASELDPESDPRDLVAEIVRLNQLGDSSIEAGQEIAVPLRFAQMPGVVSGAELGR